MPNRHFSDLFSLAKLMESLRMESEQQSASVHPINRLSTQSDQDNKVVKNTSSGVRSTRFLSLTVPSTSSVTVRNCYVPLSMDYLRSSDNAFSLVTGLSQGNTSSLSLSLHV